MIEYRPVCVCVCVCVLKRVGWGVLGKPWSCQNRWEMGRAAGWKGCAGCWRRRNPAQGYFWKGAMRLVQKKGLVEVLIPDKFLLKMQFLNESK